jgi:hypothetical protein
MMFFVLVQAVSVLIAERIDAVLSVMAEVCLESVVEAGQRQKAAEDFEAFEHSALVCLHGHGAARSGADGHAGLASF